MQILSQWYLADCPAKSVVIVCWQIEIQTQISYQLNDPMTKYLSKFEQIGRRKLPNMWKKLVCTIWYPILPDLDAIASDFLKSKFATLHNQKSLRIKYEAANPYQIYVVFRISRITFRQVTQSKGRPQISHTLRLHRPCVKRGHRILGPESQVKYLIGLFAAGKFTEGYQGGPPPFFVR